MSYHTLMYNPLKAETPYAAYLQNRKKRLQNEANQEYYASILKFKESRFPRKLLQELEKEINPFELSLQKLKEFYIKRYPEYSNDMVCQCVQHIFGRKCQESEMINKASLIIERGEEQIRHGRKLEKEEFTFNFTTGEFTKTYDDWLSTQHKAGPTSLTKKEIQKPQDEMFESENKDRQFKAITERINTTIREELNNERERYESIQKIVENSSDDLMHRQNVGLTNRSSESYPRFMKEDMLYEAEFQQSDTGRNDLQKLNRMLQNFVRNYNKVESNQYQSRKSSQVPKLDKDVEQNLYNIEGNIKLHLVKRSLSKIKKNN